METAAVGRVFQEGVSCGLRGPPVFVDRVLALSSGDPLSVPSGPTLDPHQRDARGSACRGPWLQAGPQSVDFSAVSGTAAG